MLKHLLETYLTENPSPQSTRYIEKRNPDLWLAIMRATSFLLDDALPKQRCWHVLNDIWDIPTCPITGTPVKWQENRYQTYSSRSAMAKDPQIVAKKLQTYKKRTGNDCYWSGSKEHKATVLKRNAERKAATGRVYKPFNRSESWHQKIQETWDRKLETHNLDRTELANYRRQVNRYTLRNYRNHFDKVSPNSVTRSRSNHIDHIYSVFDAWKNNVPPEVVSHWTNLRMMSGRKNIQKYTSSDKTLDQLYEDIRRSETC